MAKLGFNVVDAVQNSVQPMGFAIQGWPRTRLSADLMIDLTELRPGMTVTLRLLKRVSAKASLKNVKLIRESRLYQLFRVTEGRQGFLRNLNLKASDRFQAALEVVIPKDAPDGNYRISVAEIIGGKEMGRVTQMYAVGKSPYIGNRQTHELHLPKCDWVSKIGKRNRVAVKDLQQALRHGYNGCRFCLPKYNTG